MPAQFDQPSQGNDCKDSFDFIAKQLIDVLKMCSKDDLIDVSILQQTMQDGFKRLKKLFLENHQVEWDEKQRKYLEDLEKLTIYTTSRLAGIEVKPVADPNKGDSRFKDESWSTLPLFDHIKQFYLLSQKYALEMIESLEYENNDQKSKLLFYWRNFLDACSPSNFPQTNPEVLKEIVRTNGESLIKGSQRFIHDHKNNQAFNLTGHVKNTDFTLGRDLATTKGKVVFENHLFQLLCFEPDVEKIHKKPLLIVAPWINKYYIFDLRPENSFVRWLNSKGIRVFVISWINPGPEYADISLRDYVIDGVKSAVDFIISQYDVKKVNTAGYCSGGCLLSILAAYYGYGNQYNPLASISLLATPCNFEKMGDLKVFVSEEQVNYLEKQLVKTGVLSGDTMVKTFSWMRSNDLIWSNFINTYLLNREKPPLDFLYWNCDYTHTPARMHVEYLRHIFLENALNNPDYLIIDSVPIDMRRVNIPAYIMSAKSDHIVPYLSSYAFCQLMPNSVFTMSAAGHVAGVINHPKNKKYCYWASEVTPNNFDDWKNSATEHKGSWWKHWHKWLKNSLGQKIDSNKIPFLAEIEPAPGRYALAQAEKIG